MPRTSSYRAIRFVAFLQEHVVHPSSQALTSIGIFEDMKLARSNQDLRRFTGGRSVYSEQQLLKWDAASEHQVKFIDFLPVGYITPPIMFDELVAEGVFNGYPQSIVKMPAID